MTKRRKAAYRALLVLGWGLIALGISVNYAFLGAGVVFVLIGAIGMRKHLWWWRRKATDESEGAGDLL